MNKSIPAQFEVVKVAEDQFDVLVFSSNSVLKAFQMSYPETVYIERSKFNDLPIIAVPNFDSNFKARTWVGYWQEALNDPEKACTTCEIVQYFFKLVSDFQNKELDARQTPNDPRGQKKED